MMFWLGGAAMEKVEGRPLEEVKKDIMAFLRKATSKINPFGIPDPTHIEVSRDKGHCGLHLQYHSIVSYRSPIG